MKKRIIRAESGDLIQFLLGKYNNHQIHCAIYFEEHLDINALYKAMTVSMNTFPILQSRFVLKKRPHWEIDECLQDRAISLITCSTCEESTIIDCILASTINLFEGPQLQCTVIKSENRDILCIKLNHMVSDVGGLKEYLYHFALIYTQLIHTGRYSTNLIVSRNFKQISSQILILNKIRMFVHRYPQNKHMKTADQSLHFDLSGGKSATPFIVKHTLSPENFKTLIKYSKNHCTTVNDILMTAFIRTIYKSMQIPQTKSITVPCPVDIRKYFNNTGTLLFCNLSPVIFCNIGTDIGNTFQDTLLKVKSVMDSEKSSLPDAKISSNLKIQFLVNHFQFNFFKTVFIKMFPNPSFVMTNIGLIQKERLVFGDVKPLDVFISGSIKEPPALQLAISTYNNRMTFTINLRGLDDDKNKLNLFMESFTRELEKGIQER